MNHCHCCCHTIASMYWLDHHVCCWISLSSSHLILPSLLLFPSIFFPFIFPFIDLPFHLPIHWSIPTLTYPSPPHCSPFLPSSCPINLLHFRSIPLSVYSYSIAFAHARATDQNNRKHQFPFDRSINRSSLSLSSLSLLLSLSTSIILVITFILPTSLPILLPSPSLV